MEQVQNAILGNLMTPRRSCSAIIVIPIKFRSATELYNPYVSRISLNRISNHLIRCFSHKHFDLNLPSLQVHTQNFDKICGKDYTLMLCLSSTRDLEWSHLKVHSS